MNKGNVLFHKGDYEKAREYYREALNNDSSCVEALYNLGNRLRRFLFYFSNNSGSSQNRIRTQFSLFQACLIKS